VGRSRRSAGEGESATRTAILDAAERLFAQRGVQAVSNRQIATAAGQGNTSVVGYYFESRADLVRALVRRYNDRVDRVRDEMLAEIGDSADPRDWIECLVYPYTDVFAAAGPPGCHAQFAAQAVADPALRKIVLEEASSPALQRFLQGLNRCLPDLPPDVQRERTRIASHIIVHTCADRERALADGRAVQSPTWREAAAMMVDALVGLLTAPAPAGGPVPPIG